MAYVPVEPETTGFLTTAIIKSLIIVPPPICEPSERVMVTVWLETDVVRVPFILEALEAPVTPHYIRT